MRENAERFDGLAETYALYRPAYPPQAFADLVAAVNTGMRIAVDVGAGPGTSTRGLRAALAKDWMVTAIEPGRDMRRVLGRSFQSDPGVQVIDAVAEELPLATGSAGLVTACSSFHWFEREAFFAEAERVLAPGGILGLLRNRHAPGPITESFDAYIAEQCIAARDYGARQRRKEPVVRELGALAGFRTARSHTYRWSARYELRGLIDLYLTRSTLWSIVRRIGLGQVMDDLTVIGAEQGGGPWEIGFETTLKHVQRR